MIPYWLFFICVTLGAIAPKGLRSSQRRFVWLLVGLMIAIMLGFRHEVGGDWFNYERQFDVVASMSFIGAVENTKDPGYYPLGWILARLGGSIYWLNFACALILTAGTMRLASRQTRPWLALVAAVPYLLIVVGMGYTRQSAAVGCAMLGLAALGDGKVRAFVIWVLVGAAFHKSAVLLIPVAALAATNNRILTFTWVSLMAGLGYWLFVEDSADYFIRTYVDSDYADAAEGAGIRVAMSVIPALLMLLFHRRFTDDAHERKLWTLLSWGALVCALLLPVSATAVDRMALYLIPLQLFIFGRITHLGSSDAQRTLLVVGVIVYYALVQFVWLNFASHADLWIPYRMGVG